jgi:hypothetical protein
MVSGFGAGGRLLLAGLSTLTADDADIAAVLAIAKSPRDYAPARLNASARSA